MSYNPTNWVNGQTPINDSNLNHIEQGIKAVSDLADSQESRINQIANNQIPESYLQQSVDNYIANNQAGLATKTDINNLSSEIDKYLVGITEWNNSADSQTFSIPDNTKFIIAKSYDKNLDMFEHITSNGTITKQYCNNCIAISNINATEITISGYSNKGILYWFDDDSIIKVAFEKILGDEEFLSAEFVNYAENVNTTVNKYYERDTANIGSAEGYLLYDPIQLTKGIYYVKDIVTAFSILVGSDGRKINLDNYLNTSLSFITEETKLVLNDDYTLYATGSTSENYNMYINNVPGILGSLYLRVEELEKNENVNYYSVSKLVVDINGNGDFTDIKSALDSITDNSKKNRYVISVKPGTYDISDTSLPYLGFKNYVEIIGEHKTRCIVANRKSSTTYNAEYSVFDPNYYADRIEYSAIKNMTLISEGGKCPVHIDTDYNHLVDGGVIRIENCVLRDMNNPNTMTNFSASGNIWGGVNVGLGGGQSVEVYNCDSNGIIYAHTRPNQSKGCKFDVRNCICQYGQVADLLDNSNDDEFNFINCDVKQMSIAVNTTLGTNIGIFSPRIDFSGSKFEYFRTYWDDGSSVGDVYSLWDNMFDGKFAFPASCMHKLVLAKKEIHRGSLVTLDEYSLVGCVIVREAKANDTVYGIAVESINANDYGYIQFKGCIDAFTQGGTINGYAKLENGVLVSSDTPTNMQVVSSVLVKLL